MQNVKLSAPNFFAWENCLEKLSGLGDPLERLDGVIDWESFRTKLQEALDTSKKPELGGRPSFDPVMMFKIVILQQYYSLSDDQLEYQVVGRMSFRRFLGLQLEDSVPDAKTL